MKTGKEALKKAWDLVHNKYPENNEEIQLVRYAIKTAMELNERDTPMKPKPSKNPKAVSARCVCSNVVMPNDNFCSKCGQRLDWSNKDE